MTSRITDADIEGQFVQVRRRVRKYGVNSLAWELVPGEIDEKANHREPWEIVDSQGISVVMLGYTRREAMNNLQSMNALLSVLEEVNDVPS